MQDLILCKVGKYTKKKNKISKFVTLFSKSIFFYTYYYIPPIILASCNVPFIKSIGPDIRTLSARFFAISTF